MLWICWTSRLVPLLQQSFQLLQPLCQPQQPLKQTLQPLNQPLTRALWNSVSSSKNFSDLTEFKLNCLRNCLWPFFWFFLVTTSSSHWKTLSFLFIAIYSVLLYFACIFLFYVYSILLCFLHSAFRFFMNPTQLTKHDIESNDSNISQLQSMVRKKQQNFLSEHLIRKNSKPFIRDTWLKWFG